MLYPEMNWMPPLPPVTLVPQQEIAVGSKGKQEEGRNPVSTLPFDELGSAPVCFSNEARYSVRQFLPLGYGRWIHEYSCLPEPPRDQESSIL